VKRVRRFKLRRSGFKLSDGGVGFHTYVTVPSDVAEKWKEWGVALVDVEYDDEEPLELRVTPVRAERVGGGAQGARGEARQG
jgi:hypothetical protein